jgi:hypothetical protein
MPCNQQSNIPTLNPILGLTCASMVMDIPVDLSSLPQYLIMFNDGMTRSVSSQDMPTLILKPVTSVSDTSHLLLPFLDIGSKITFEHEGQFHTGFLSKTLKGIYCFSYKSHINKNYDDWGVNIPNLPMAWQDVCIYGILLPGHQSSLFIWFHKQPPSANFINALNLKGECPRSLLVTLNTTHPDQQIWLDSFCKEKTGSQSQNTYIKIGLKDYRALREQGAPCAIPTMCVLAIKKDAMLNPIRAKLCIVILGNHKDHIWTKSEKYATVLQPNTMRLITSMVVEKCCTLK